MRCDGVGCVFERLVLALYFLRTRRMRMMVARRTPKMKRVFGDWNRSRRRSKATGAAGAAGAGAVVVWGAVSAAAVTLVVSVEVVSSWGRSITVGWFGVWAGVCDGPYCTVCS